MEGKSIWDDKQINETKKRMDPGQYYRYEQMMNSLFNKVSNDPKIISVHAATQIKLMLRDGLDPTMLDNDEKEIYISTFGVESLKEYEIPREHLSDIKTKNRNGAL